jgi:hypothetical protein
VVGPTLPLPSTSTFTTPSKHPKGQVLVGQMGGANPYHPSKQCPGKRRSDSRTRTRKVPRGALCFTNEQKNPNSFTFLRHGTARQHR